MSADMIWEIQHPILCLENKKHKNNNNNNNKGKIYTIRSWPESKTLGQTNCMGYSLSLSLSLFPPTLFNFAPPDCLHEWFLWKFNWIYCPCLLPILILTASLAMACSIWPLHPSMQTSCAFSIGLKNQLFFTIQFIFATFHRYHCTFWYYSWVLLYYFSYLLDLFIVLLAKSFQFQLNKLFPNRYLMSINFVALAQWVKLILNPIQQLNLDAEMWELELEMIKTFRAYLVVAFKYFCSKWYEAHGRD